MGSCPVRMAAMTSDILELVYPPWEMADDGWPTPPRGYFAKFFNLLGLKVWYPTGEPVMGAGLCSTIFIISSGMGSVRQLFFLGMLLLILGLADG